jgi:hypothetical protein
MAGFAELLGIGSVTDAYTDTDYTTNRITARVGDTYYDLANKVKYIFLKNTGSASIAASDFCTATTTMSATFTCKQGTGGTAQEPFAGTRAVGATALAQNQYGWFAFGGQVTLTCDATGTTVSKNVTSSTSVAGAIRVGSNTFADTMNPCTIFGHAQATSTTTCVVNVSGSVWGL